MRAPSRCFGFKPGTLILIVLSVVMLLSWLSLKLLPVPFLWVFMVWSLGFLSFSIPSGRTWIRLICFNFFALFLILCAFELLFWISKTGGSEASQSAFKVKGLKYHTAAHPILGYAPVKNTQRSVTLLYDDEIVYDVVYTIGRDGLRITPSNHGPKAPAILFFGGSFTYGEGVSDEEAMPYVVGMLTGGGYAVYNFAVHGYGPQHMLASLEHGLVASRLKHRPRYAVYQAILDHVFRVDSWESWLMNGPHYVLDPEGGILRQSHSEYSWYGIRAVLNESHLFRAVSGRLNLIRNMNGDWQKNEAVSTFAALVDRSQKLLRSKYPGLEFHLILWDDGNDDFSDIVMDALNAKDVKTHKISDILGEDLSRNEAKYCIPHDLHPTPLTHRIIAEYVVREIID